MNPILFLLRQHVEQGLIIALVLAMFTGFIVLALFLNKRTMDRCWNNAIAIADELNIPAVKPEIGWFTRKLPFIKGVYRNHQISLHTEIRGSGKHRHPYTIITIIVPEIKFDLEVYKEGFFSKIGKAFGMQDIQTGFDDFDKKFMLRSADEQSALKTFDMDLCARFTESHPILNSGIYVKSRILSYTEMTHLTSERKRDNYRAIIQLSYDLIAKVEKPGTKLSGGMRSSGTIF